MNTTEVQTGHGALPESLASVTATRSVAEAIGGIAAVILAVIGLAGILSSLMAAIATIVVGVGILVEGWTVNSSHRRLNVTGSTHEVSSGLGSSLTAEFLGGIAGIVLGILGLFRAAPDPMLSIALLIYGATLLLGSMAASQMQWRSNLTAGGTETWVSTPFAAAFSGQLLVGLGAIVLGILAVIGLVPMTLVLVGLLSLAAVMLLGQFR